MPRYSSHPDEWPTENLPWAQGPGAPGLKSGATKQGPTRPNALDKITNDYNSLLKAGDEEIRSGKLSPEMKAFLKEKAAIAKQTKEFNRQRQDEFKAKLQREEADYKRKPGEADESSTTAKEKSVSPDVNDRYKGKSFGELREDAETIRENWDTQVPLSKLSGKEKQEAIKDRAEARAVLDKYDAAAKSRGDKIWKPELSPAEQKKYDKEFGVKAGEKPTARTTKAQKKSIAKAKKIWKEGGTDSDAAAIERMAKREGWDPALVFGKQYKPDPFDKFRGTDAQSSGDVIGDYSAY